MFDLAGIQDMATDLAKKRVEFDTECSEEGEDECKSVEVTTKLPALLLSLPLSPVFESQAHQMND
jgi:hypothetical protein